MDNVIDKTKKLIDSFESSELISKLDYYKRIAKLFNKKLDILESSLQNPILWLNAQENIIQILPLRKEGIKHNLLFSMRNVENLSAYLINKPQLYVPISV